MSRRPNAVRPGSVHVPDEAASLVPFVDAGVFGATEVHLAALIGRTAPCSHEVLLGVAVAAWSSLHGHSCATLADVGRVIEESVRRTRAEDAEFSVGAPTIADTSTAETDDGDSTTAALEWPDAVSWTRALEAAPAVARIEAAHAATPQPGSQPLVLSGGRLSLERDWIDEGIIAASLINRAVPDAVELDAGTRRLLDDVLPSTTSAVDALTGRPTEVENLQRLAAETVLRQRLTVIVGGPGTGKTYTVARLLAVLVAHGRAIGSEPRIALAAPTGKAKARLRESIAASLQPGRDATGASRPNPIPDEVRATLAALVPTTIHRLLGPLGSSRQRFRHDASNLLAYDVVVVDETSMVDAPLLARLCEALPPTARLVLLGDPDQLESVERGAVLADIARAGLGEAGLGTANRSPLDGHVIRLQRGHRFGADSPIALLADAVRSGDGDLARSLAVAGSGATLTDCAAGALADDPGRPPSTMLVAAVEPLAPEAVAAAEQVVAPVLRRMRDAAASGDVAEALRWSARVRVLCAHRLGPFGVAGWNSLGERWLGEGRPLPMWYPGRPLLVTRNELRLGLANGDTGVVIRRGDALVAAFATAHGHVELDPSQLGEVETAYAMTIHKSQGSEYPAVVVVLPPLRSPLVGRELLYTAVTRTKTTLLLLGDPAVVAAATTRPARRMTGLAEALGGAAPAR